MIIYIIYKCSILFQLNIIMKINLNKKTVEVPKKMFFP